MNSIFQIDSLNIFQNVSQQIITSLYYSGTTNNALIETSVFEKAKEEMKALMFECNFDKPKINDVILNKGWQKEKVDYFQNLLEENWPELLSATLNHYNSNYCETMVNFDWIVKYVLGTSELKTLKYPLLQLILSTVNKTGQQNNLVYDINKDNLMKIINVLENI